MTKTMFTCPDCGSTNVDEYLVSFDNPNTGERGEVALAELYPDLWWCNNCNKNPGELKRVEVEADDQKPSHWGEDPDWPVCDWQTEVANDDTRQSYREWVASARAADAQDIADDWDREMLGDDALILEGMDIGDK